MQIEIKIDENCKEPKIIVLADKITEEISEIIKKLSEEQTKTIYLRNYVQQLKVASKKRPQRHYRPWGRCYIRLRCNNLACVL